MNKLLNLAEWVWIDSDTVDQYAEFTQEFNVQQKAQALLQISAPTQYAVYLNGKFIANGQYADYPHFKIYDEIDVSEYLCEGKNLLAVVCYNQGENSYPYRYKTAALAFAIQANGTPLCLSGENTLATRQSLLLRAQAQAVCVICCPLRIPAFRTRRESLPMRTSMPCLAMRIFPRWASCVKQCLWGTAVRRLKRLRASLPQVKAWVC